MRASSSERFSRHRLPRRVAITNAMNERKVENCHVERRRSVDRQMPEILKSSNPDILKSPDSQIPRFSNPYILRSSNPHILKFQSPVDTCFPPVLYSLGSRLRNESRAISA